MDDSELDAEARHDDRQAERASLKNMIRERDAAQAELTRLREQLKLSNDPDYAVLVYQEMDSLRAKIVELESDEESTLTGRMEYLAEMGFPYGCNWNEAINAQKLLRDELTRKAKELDFQIEAVAASHKRVDELEQSNGDFEQMKADRNRLFAELTRLKDEMRGMTKERDALRVCFSEASHNAGPAFVAHERLAKLEGALKEAQGVIEVMATFYRHSASWETCRVAESQEIINAALQP